MPFVPGGGADTTARFVAEPLGAELGQNVVIENRGGAGGTIGAAAVAQAPADGTVQGYRVKAGDQVADGAVLVDFEANA